MTKRRASWTTAERIAAAGESLTPTERRIAEAVLAEPTLLAFGTVSDLADEVGTSRPSIVRFANKLGFDGYTRLQRQAGSELSHRLSRPGERIRHDNQATLPARAAIADAIESVFEAVSGDRLAALAKPIARAAHVWILSGESSRAGAAAMLSGLSMIRPDVLMPDGHRLCTELSAAGPRDVGVVFDFERYRRSTVTGARLLANAGVPIIAITDSALSPLATLTDDWCELEVPGIGPFDSSIPAVTIAELIVAQVARELRRSAAGRIDRIEALWEQTGTYLADGG